VQNEIESYLSNLASMQERARRDKLFRLSGIDQGQLSASLKAPSYQMQAQRLKEAAIKAAWDRNKQLEGVGQQEYETEPWIDPVSAAAGGVGGAVPGAMRSIGKVGLKALLKPVVSGVAAAAAEYPIGAATEKIGDKYPKAALPFNVVAGMLTGAPLERMASEIAENPGYFFKFAKKLSKEQLGEIFGHHGSHALFDQFEPSKIGTGEGSHAYGWGAYVTDSKDVGKTYAVIKSGNDGYLYDVVLNKGKESGDYDYMPWDNPITGQQKEKLLSALTDNDIKLNVPSLNGSDIYSDLAYKLSEKHKMPLDNVGRPTIEAQKKASEFLSKAGINGIQYPSGTVTGKGIGGTNYVVFNPDDIEINDVRKVTQE